MKVKKLNLPKKYEYIEGKSRPEYKKYDGREKISYSQYTSFISPEYNGQYYASYFLKLRDPGNIFSDFGGWCGEYIEKREDESLYLSEEDKKVLMSIERPKNTEYEREIVIDLLPFGVDAVLQGFIDEIAIEENSATIIDSKTGNVKSKVSYYSDPKQYGQTSIYSYEIENEGYDIGYSGVILFGRKGNTLEKIHSKANNPLWLRLDGNIEYIPTPYSRKRTETLLKKISKTVVEISEHYKTYLKYFKEN